MASLYLNLRRRSMSEACAAAAGGIARSCAGCSIRDICQRSCGDPMPEAVAGVDRRPAPIEFELRLPRRIGIDQKRRWIRLVGKRRREVRRAAA